MSKTSNESPKQSRLLVVDASLMRAAGARAESHSAQCTQVLNSILTICHRVAINPTIQAEWNKHQSLFASKWRGRMIARRKIKTVTTGTQYQDLQRRLQAKRNLPNPDSAALQKDLHLLGTARVCDKVLLTSDVTLFNLNAHHQLAPEIEWLLIRQTDANSAKPVLRRLQDLARPGAKSITYRKTKSA